MRRELRLPEEVLLSVGTHIRQAIENFHRTYDSTSSSEDSLTVKLGELLNTKRSRVVEVKNFQPSGKWKWKIIYSKFSDRCRDSEEKHIGADGFIEIDVEGGEFGRKAALFQCKKRGNSYANILEQAAKLSTWREAAFFVEFAREGSAAVSLDDVVKDSKIGPDTAKTALADYLIDYFLACKIGDGDLKYFAPLKKLAWRDLDNRHVYARFAVKHRLRLKVKSPWRHWVKTPYGDIVPLEHLHEHRLDAAYQGLDERQLKLLAMIYHPDFHQRADEQTLTILDVRAREIIEKINMLRAAAQYDDPETPDVYLLKKTYSPAVPFDLLKEKIPKN